MEHLSPMAMATPEEKERESDRARASIIKRQRIERFMNGNKAFDDMCFYAQAREEEDDKFLEYYEKKYGKEEEI